MMQFWALVIDSFRQSRDRKIFWVMLVITILVAASMACISFAPGRVTLMFGLWDITTDRFTVLGGLRKDIIASIVVDFILALILGWVGVMLTIIATAGFIPAFLERGSVDVVLSKPMRRWQMFLGKYAGAMVFVLVQSAAFVTITFVVVGWRWHVWLPGYLWCIPLMVLLFSYLYCISAWVGVQYRSSVVSVIVTLGAWVAIAGVQNLDDLFVQFPSWQNNHALHTMVKSARWALPKTQDVIYLAKRCCGAAIATDLVPESELYPQTSAQQGNGPDTDVMLERAKDIEVERIAMNPVLTIGSSLLFEAIIVVLAMWNFSRRDY